MQSDAKSDSRNVETVLETIACGCLLDLLTKYKILY